jgi:hypothetical protein
MLLDASHRRWILACLVLFVVATVAYVVYARSVLQGPTGASWQGLTYGAVALALMLYAGVLGLRRRVPTWRVGRATTWMKGHLWLGLLSYGLVLYHSGFQLGGPLTLIIMVLFTAVVISGVYGVVLQQYIPQIMLARLPLETVYEQIDSVVRQLRDEADALVAAAAGPLPETPAEAPGERRGGGGLRRGAALVVPLLRPRAATTGTLPETAGMKEIYLGEIRPFLAPEKEPDSRLATPADAAALFRHLRTVVPPTFHETLQELEAICEERRQLAEQKRLHHWLHGWLLVHVPLSMALLALAVVHAVIAVRY